MAASKKRLQKVARRVRNGFGIELTPEQVRREMLAAGRRIKRGMVARGYREFAGMTPEQAYEAARRAIHGDGLEE